MASCEWISVKHSVLVSLLRIFPNSDAGSDNHFWGKRLRWPSTRVEHSHPDCVGLQDHASKLHLQTSEDSSMAFPASRLAFEKRRVKGSFTAPDLKN